MTHPNFQTNGASLEDCHTNFFALTELSGIKWRKLVYCELGGGVGTNSGHCGVGGGNVGVGGGGSCNGGEPLEDPVLRSYARCLAADILCVWRRVSTPRTTADMFEAGPPPPLSLSTSKELWIFWYGEEPDLNVLIAPELNTIDCEQGSWESGLSYECRSLLFKALHNLIERCLLSRDFIRLGKWFIQPYEGPKKYDISTVHLSFSFAFFVHGESSVCASVDVRQHPPVRRLTRLHLQQAQSSTAGLKVILAPFGLAGTITGQTFKSPDLVARFLEDWSQFYPLDKNNLTDSSVIEVIVGGVKMRYPSCYVFVTDLDDNVNNAVMVNGSNGSCNGGIMTNVTPNGVVVKNGSSSPILVQTPPPSPVQITSRVPQPGPYSVSVEHPFSMSRDETVATILPERVWQECIHGGPPNSSISSNNSQHEFTGQWDYVDPLRRASCTCSKCRKYMGSMASSKWSGGSNVKIMGQPRPGKAVRGRVPFHRRSPVPADSDRCSSSGSYTPQGGPPSYPRTQESVAVPSVGSPPSVTPSPLPNPHSQQPASVPPADQGMPMLSPHPPAIMSTSPIEKTHTPEPLPKSVESSTANSPSCNNNNSNTNNNNSSSSTPPTVDMKNEQLTNNVTASIPALKRPILSSKEYESALGEDEQYLEMLYDYTTMDAWLNHPVKRFKNDEKETNKRNHKFGSKIDIYTMYSHNGMAYNNSVDVTNNLNTNKNQFLKQEIKQEFGLNVEADSTVTTPTTLQNHGVKRPGDPYEFDEEGASAACSIDGFKRGQVKEEPKDIKKITTGNSLFTNEGLQPSYKDLDQIFDNSDDTSSDEPIHIQTPPGATTLSQHDDNKRLCPSVGILRPEELSKMFPTPPSLEHNPIASPCGQLDLPLPDYTDLGIIRPKQEIYPNMGSPQEENIDDWSYVFKPPIICKMVGSSKYAPLTNLPSQGLSPVSLPSHCVYKPSWAQHHAEKMQTNNNNNCNNNNNNNNNANSNSTNSGNNISSAGGNTTSGSSATGGIPMVSSGNNSNSIGNNGQPLTPSMTASTPSVMNSSPVVVPNNLHHQSAMNPYPSSPLHSAGATTPGSNFRQPPPPYELPSPATSTASSYLNKNLNSIEAATTPSVQRTAEANSLALNILLTDTASNIFRDHNFDSCTLCVCNAGGRVVGNIRGADAGVYLISGTTCDKSISGHGLHSMQQQQPSSPYPGGGMGGQPPPPYGSSGILSPLHQQMPPLMEEDSIRCSCGFSAVVNRRLAYGSGLFYEDEMEITGIADDPGEKKKNSPLTYLMSTPNTIKMETSLEREQIDILPHSLLELVREQCVFIPSTANALCRAARFIRTTKTTTTTSAAASNLFSSTIHVLEYTDTNEVTTIALEQTKQQSYDSMSVCKMEEKPNSKSLMFAVHRWPFLRASGPQCNQDIVRVMRTLQPLLQEAIQKKCQTRLWEAPSAVKGPLTWRQFHRLAGRGTDDRCEPQPIPSVVVGHDKDWLSLSPYAIQHWESLLLEPYSFSRDVAYIVVAPDNDAILPRVRTFFKELSTAYEMCKLGRHSPITKVLRDGILRVGKTAKSKLGNEPVEEWFTMLGDGDLCDMLKLYAQVCKHHLAPHLQQVPMDKTLLDPPQEAPDKPTSSPMPPPPNTPDNSNGGQSTIASTTTATSNEKAPSTPKSEQDGDMMKDGPTQTASMVENNHDDEEREIPSVVVYLVEPFSMGSDQPELQRLAYLALLRCFQSVLSAVPENIRNNINVQIISLESIVELGKARDRTRHSDHMRALSLNIFSQCRRLLVHSNNVKSLTGFGTAAMADLFLKSKDEKNRAAYKLYTPPYILAPMREKVEAVESFGKGSGDQASVLYLSYCLSEDQSWLLAVATDERGEIFETVTINIDIPNRSRRKKASARRIGLEKLMNFILGVMSQSVRPWRLVVGRLGRIGHGELKGWSWLLSKKNLLKASKHLKEICNQCALMYPTSVPCILSACLVSLEPDSVLRLMPDQFTPDERFSQASVNSQLSTPQDVTCTHILVFPTSATTQSSQTAFQEQHITPELGDDELFNVLNDDMTEGIENMNDFSDIFNWPEAGAGGGQSPTGSPKREESGSGSPTNGVNAGRQGSPFPCINNLKGSETIEEVGTLLQQPLALGYFVSTAPTGRMPKWFWSSCPHLEGVCPAFLKNALHLHSPNIQQVSDDLFQQSAVTSHPLDSQYTTDVLRYVLEGYNALSWLALDSNTKDRLSCLPVHMQVLVQLYHTTAALL